MIDPWKRSAGLFALFSLLALLPCCRGNNTCNETTYEAENMTASTGMADGDAGWVLLENGHVSQSHDFVREDWISVRARGSPAAWIWPQMCVEIDTTPIFCVETNTDTWKTYVYPIPELTGNSEIKVSFTNNDHLWGKLGDRNLYLDKLVLGCNDASSQLPAPAGSVVEQHGSLRVSGTQIVGEHGNPVQLRGMSLFWHMWGSCYYTPGVVKTLVQEWNCTLLRVPIGVDFFCGYNCNANSAWELLRVAVNAAIELGIYVIVDWHTETTQVEGARGFFRQVATEYGHYPNILYELFNEPVRQTWSDELKPYAEELIQEIRPIDPNNIIIMGTGDYSKDVDDAAMDPILISDNIAYTLHFYAGSHGPSSRNIKAQVALDAGLCLFVTENGVNRAGDDNDRTVLYLTEFDLWHEFLDARNISWASWRVGGVDCFGCEQDEISEATCGADANGVGWVDSVLTASGLYYRHKINDLPDAAGCNTCDLCDGMDNDGDGLIDEDATTENRLFANIQSHRCIDGLLEYAWYGLRFRHQAQWCLQPEGGNTSEGTELQQWPCENTTHQQFRLEEAPGGGGYFLINRKSGLQVRQLNSTSDWKLVLTANKGETEKFAVTENAYGAFSFNNSVYDRCFGAPDASLNEIGAKVIGKECIAPEDYEVEDFKEELQYSLYNQEDPLFNIPFPPSGGKKP